MKTFTDNTGRTWSITVNVGTIKRVRALCGIDLASIITIKPGTSPDAGLLEQLATDPVLLVDTLYAVCKPEADALHISDEEFGRAMAGNAVELATAALLDEVIDFFPDVKRQVFRKILEATRRFENQGREALENMLDDPELDSKIDKAMEELMKSSSNSQESSE